MSHECFKNLKSDFKDVLTLARGEFRRAIPVAMVRKVVEFVIFALLLVVPLGDVQNSRISVRFRRIRSCDSQFRHSDGRKERGDLPSFAWLLPAPVPLSVLDSKRLPFKFTYL